MATSIVKPFIEKKASNLMGGLTHGSDSISDNQIVKIIPKIERDVVERICGHIMANNNTLGGEIVELLEGRLKEILEPDINKPDAIEKNGDINIKIGEIVLDRFRKDFASIDDAPLFLLTLSLDHRDKIIFIINDILTKNPDNVKEYFANIFGKSKSKSSNNPSFLSFFGGATTKKRRTIKFIKSNKRKSMKKMKKMKGGTGDLVKRTSTHTPSAVSTHTPSETSANEVSNNGDHAISQLQEAVIPHIIKDLATNIIGESRDTAQNLLLQQPQLIQRQQSNKSDDDQVNAYIDKIIGFLTFRLKHTGDEILKKIMANIDEAMKQRKVELAENIIKGTSFLIANSFASADPKKGANLIEIMIYSSLYKLRGTLQKCIDEVGRDPNNKQSDSFASDVYEKLMSSIAIK